MDITLNHEVSLFPEGRIHPGSSGWTEPSSFVLQINLSTGGTRGDIPAMTFSNEELPLSVLVDWAASTPLTGGNIHSTTVSGGLDSLAGHNDDGLARRFDAWSDEKVRDMAVPFAIRDPVPASSGYMWGLACAVHRPSLTTELRTDAPTPIGGFEEVEALGSLDCVSLVIGRGLVVVSVVKVLAQTETDPGYFVLDHL